MPFTQLTQQPISRNRVVHWKINFVPADHCDPAVERISTILAGRIWAMVVESIEAMELFDQAPNCKYIPSNVFAKNLVTHRLTHGRGNRVLTDYKYQRRPEASMIALIISVCSF